MLLKALIAVGLAAFPAGAIVGHVASWKAYEPCELHYDPDTLNEWPYECYGYCGQFPGEEADCYIKGSPSQPEGAL